MGSRNPNGRPREVDVDTSTPESLGGLTIPFSEHLRVLNYSEETVYSREYQLRCFIHWCDERGVSYPQEVTDKLVERYQRYLHRFRKKNGKALSINTQMSHLSGIRVYFKWLYKEGYVERNPTLAMVMPKEEKRLPRNVAIEKMEEILSRADIETPLGLRDRAMMEVMYSTGLRRAELSKLSVYDVNTRHGILTVRQGKGKKDRIVPIGERAIKWVEKYIVESRWQLLKGPDDGRLFLSFHSGQGVSSGCISATIRGYIQASGVTEQGCCHIFRHTMATSMLDNGADIRYIQEMLGHSFLSTTQIYTKVSIAKLKEVHAATHPAKLKRSEEEEGNRSL